MNKMYEYLEEHAYISKNKKSNYQFELSKERAECIANKYNSLIEDKDLVIERLNNIINELEKHLRNMKEVTGRDCKGNIEYIPNRTALSILNYMQELKGSDKE